MDGGEGGKDESYFLIRKHYRDGPSAVRTLTLYFVVGADLPGGSARGTVFPLPDMHSVFAYNLVRSTCPCCCFELLLDLAPLSSRPPRCTL